MSLDAFYLSFSLIMETYATQRTLKTLPELPERFRLVALGMPLNLSQRRLSHKLFQESSVEGNSNGNRVSFKRKRQKRDDPKVDRRLTEDTVKVGNFHCADPSVLLPASSFQSAGALRSPAIER